METDCWTLPKDYIDPNGYGRINGQLAHRMIYELLVEPIPSGLQIDHLCRNRACCNPTHLEPVTRSENLRRAPAELRRKGGLKTGAKNRAKTECIHGHEFTEENTYWHPDGRRDCLACKELRTRKCHGLSHKPSRKQQRQEALLLAKTAKPSNAFHRGWVDLLEAYGKGGTLSSIAEAQGVTTGTVSSKLKLAQIWARQFLVPAQ